MLTFDSQIPFMKNCLLLSTACLFSLLIKAANKDSAVNYFLPDSVKAISLLSDIRIGQIDTKKEFKAGIKDGDITVYIEKDKKDLEFVFEFPSTSLVVASGLNIKSEKGELTWHYNGSPTDIYKLLLATATDSAGNFIVYSGYVFLPKENKWKLLGTCKITGRWGTLKAPATYFTQLKKGQPPVNFSSVWCQRTNGSWKNLKDVAAMPVVNLFSHVDSTQQAINEIKLINNAVTSNKTDAKQNKEGIYYTVLKEGTGRQVMLTDTVVAYYKGYLFSDGSIFDQTKDKPATFPLKRLIRGWQIGVPLCKVGGKIRLVIPSGLAYSIRTRAAKIPPNSILVFEIDVVDAKEGQ
jgi:FKBP-type peptidyl-prolyl cis-trans isomerase FkpA